MRATQTEHVMRAGADGDRGRMTRSFKCECGMDINPGWCISANGLECFCGAFYACKYSAELGDYLERDRERDQVTASAHAMHAECQALGESCQGLGGPICVGSVSSMTDSRVCARFMEAF